MKIEIKSISLKNFLSVGQKWLNIDFRKGLFRVTGENLDTGSRNGVGKSTIFVDSLMFGLFGKTVRKINIPDIPNTINNSKGCEVKVKFTIGNVNYEIHRGISPSFLKLYKDGVEEIQDSAKKFTQKKIDEIIGSDFNTFSHLLIMSSSYSTPFLDLDTNKKRGILEDILGVSVFGKMSDVLRKQSQDLNSDYKITTKEYELSTRSMNHLKDNITLLLKKSKDFKTTNKNKKDEVLKLIKTVNEKVAECKTQIINESKCNDEINLLNKKKTELTNDINSISINTKMWTKEISNNKKLLDELHNNPVCPVCNTTTNSEHVKEHIESLSNVITNNETLIIDNNSIKVKYKDELEEIQLSLEDYNAKLKLSEKNNDKINSLNEKIVDLKSRLNDIKNEVNNFEEMINKDELKKMKKEVGVIKEKLSELIKEKDYAEYIKKLLSDNGIKNYIIKKILTFWNKKVNFYLKELNSDFSIIFDENLDAVIKSRNRDPLQYHSFSGGEKARIDVAILCSVLDLSKLQNSMDLNLMVIDELLDSALDSGGREDVLKLLRQKSLEEKACIYVISHATDLPTELFDKEITLYKKNGFTYV